MAAAADDAREARNLAGDASKKASDLAYEKGKSDADTAAQFAEIRRHFKSHNGSIDRICASVERVEERLTEIEKREGETVAVAKATARSVEQHGQAQITTRTFATGVVGIVISIGALFVAVSPPGA